ncbi:enoyl-CoA hydratase-related protein [Sphingomonas colocasiae]|uniref:Enoyl-CoA hydratase/isomerase family protein n=1 Tax=Sphingomonas colocasiae TaxID=1848973 RepID=A0ABS7PKE4_9SPHN|nr:enoyl-CoA hydratase-related protein [Sphingomonas colocasiae]MBY8821756.1 enoyl-CoA hydratase/isomerase family protein [Sphingomonas colocasiae]
MRDDEADMAGSDDLLADIRDHVMTIRFNRPTKRNAITYAMYERIIDLIGRAERDDTVRCLLFAGSGPIFTAGHDVSGFAQGLALAYDEKPSYIFMKRLADFSKPVAAALNGDAVGIGATMLFHCDFVYAVPDCRLVFPFADMGLIPEFASSAYLPQLVGQRRAMALLLKDRGCSAEEGIALGIVNETVAAENLAAHVANRLAGITALSPDAVAETKRLLKAGTREAIGIAIAEEARSFHDLLHSPFVRDRLAAIRQRISAG